MYYFTHIVIYVIVIALLTATLVLPSYMIYGQLKGPLVTVATMLVITYVYDYATKDL